MSLSDYFADFIEADELTVWSNRDALPGISVTEHAPGVLALMPGATAPDAEATIISAGIHGNETAPIELLGELVAALDAGQLRVGAPTLLMLGNRRAIMAGKRHVDTNLNRLFRRDTLLRDDERFECQRARELMQAVDQFMAEVSGPVLHLDMHTAIRDSRYPRFAVEPFSDTPTPDNLWRQLADAGIQAGLSQHQHSWTFSHYTRHYHGAMSFTLELGRVAPFGGNDLEPLAPMLDLLRARIAGATVSAPGSATLVRFEVTDEIMRESDDFRLCFAEDIANFTEFAPGSRLAIDGAHGEWIVEGTPAHIVFPNARVERGARALLLARPVTQALPESQ
ncbi:succinylglutamate desuccinylase [Kushneria indalinina]|uniref:Succinylglutamate desuccinylase n=1 Tax=Kushneria indalinina DSM 14324 TaxID=1122140 RepID=A0A3D9DXA7_9GAMM|nr:succinylglutamate desuccinylase [Kushneria indalinina]REC95408.1 succinylglutamate desuccinylase [Kushneria indalinina DSM 14324]